MIITNNTITKRADIMTSVYLKKDSTGKVILYTKPLLSLNYAAAEITRHSTHPCLTN